MRFILLILFSILTISSPALAQSGRPAQPDAVAGTAETDLTVKQMFDTANGFLKVKYAEFEEKKVRYTDALASATKQEQRQLAARYAATAGARKDLAGDDLYYLGMLHWLAENYDGMSANFLKYVAIDGTDPQRRQTARSL